MCQKARFDSGEAIVNTQSKHKPVSPSQLRILSTEEKDQWMEVLGRNVRHDFYHLPQYHRLEERRLQAVGNLFIYYEDEYLIALPLLLRPVGEGSSEWNDAA